LAKKKHVSMANISLAWLLHQEAVSAPIVGVTKISQLEDAVDALDINLTQEELDDLEKYYKPHKVVGAR
ncbi:MAG TPA: aldo/keto reductase, partial [Erysipelothrix sp.]|nr:aldo/keto reductase [Erysipelothrix sp.]